MFLGPEGCEYIKAYLEKRLADGEELRSDSAVITYKSGYGETEYQGVEDMRESYPDEDRLREDFRRQLLLLAGFSGEEMDGLDFSMGDKGLSRLCAP